MEHGSITPTQSQPTMPTTGKKPNTAIPKKQPAKPHHDHRSVSSSMTFL
jgi:hypothetical protein